MVVKIMFVASALLAYVLIILAFQYATSQAKKVNGLVFRELKEEVRNGLVIRGFFSLLYYFCLIDWVFGIGLVPFLYLPLPRSLNWVGLGLLFVTVGFFWWIQVTIGPNYHGPKHLHANHRLITTGPYKYMRHPTYLAFLLMHLSYALLTSNWGVLISGVIMSSIVNHYRMSIEEQLLAERFGSEYDEYRKRTWKLFPKFL